MSKNVHLLIAEVVGVRLAEFYLHIVHPVTVGLRSCIVILPGTVHCESAASAIFAHSPLKPEYPCLDCIRIEQLCIEHVNADICLAEE